MQDLQSFLDAIAGKQTSKAANPQPPKTFQQVVDANSAPRQTDLEFLKQKAELAMTLAKQSRKYQMPQLRMLRQQMNKDIAAGNYKRIKAFIEAEQREANLKPVEAARKTYVPPPPGAMQDIELKPFFTDPAGSLSRYQRHLERKGLSSPPPGWNKEAWNALVIAGNAVDLGTGFRVLNTTDERPDESRTSGERVIESIANIAGMLPLGAATAAPKGASVLTKIGRGALTSLATDIPQLTVASAQAGGPAELLSQMGQSAASAVRSSSGMDAGSRIEALLLPALLALGAGGAALGKFSDFADARGAQALEALRRVEAEGRSASIPPLVPESSVPIRALPGLPESTKALPSPARATKALPPSANKILAGDSGVQGIDITDGAAPTPRTAVAVKVPEGTPVRVSRTFGGGIAKSVVDFESPVDALVYQAGDSLYDVARPAIEALAKSGLRESEIRAMVDQVRPQVDALLEAPGSRALPAFYSDYVDVRTLNRSGPASKGVGKETTTSEDVFLNVQGEPVARMVKKDLSKPQPAPPLVKANDISFGPDVEKTTLPKPSGRYVPLKPQKVQAKEAMMQSLTRAPKKKYGSRARQRGFAMIPGGGKPTPRKYLKYVNNAPLSKKKIAAYESAMRSVMAEGYQSADKALQTIKSSVGRGLPEAILKETIEVLRRYEKPNLRQVTAQPLEPAPKPSSKGAPTPPPKQPTYAEASSATGISKAFRAKWEKLLGEEPGTYTKGGKFFRLSDDYYRDMLTSAEAPLVVERALGLADQSKEAGRFVGDQFDILEMNAASAYLNNRIVKAMTDGVAADVVDLQSQAARLMQGAELASNFWHSVGMSLQYAVEPDYSVVDLAQLYKNTMGTESVPKDIQADISSIQASRAKATKAQEAAIKKIVADLNLSAESAQVARMVRGAATAVGKASQAGRLPKDVLAALDELRAAGIATGSDAKAVKRRTVPKSKQGGFIDVGTIGVRPRADQAKAINRLVNAIINYHGRKQGVQLSLDDVVELAQYYAPALRRDSILQAMSGEYMRANVSARLASLQAARLVRHFKRLAERQLQPLGARLASIALEFAFSAARSVKATGELSMLGIQGMPGLLTDPAAYAKSIRPLMKSLAKGGDFADELIQQRLNEPAFQQALDDGVAFTHTHESFSAQEEMFAGSFISSMKKSKVIPLRVLGQIVDRADAGFSVFLNELRYEMYKTLSRIDPEDELFRRDVAKIVNVYTGRGHGKAANFLSRNAELASGALFSPRFLLSTWQLGGQAFAPFGAWKSTRGRLVGIAQAAKLATAVMGATLMLEQLGAEVDKRPNSSNFGAFKLGDRWYAPFHKILEPIRVLAQLTEGRISRAGNLKKPGEYGAYTPANYIEGKLHPIFKLVSTALSKHRYSEAHSKSVPVTVGDAIILVGVPMTYEQALFDLKGTGSWSDVFSGDPKGSVAGAQQGLASNFFGIPSFESKPPASPKTAKPESKYKPRPKLTRGATQ